MKIYKDESGIAHLALVGVVVAVILVIGFVGWRVMSKESQDNNVNYSAENLPENLEGLKSIEEIENDLKLPEDVKIEEYSLESDDNVAIYVIKLSDGRELKINAITGEVISDSDNKNSKSSSDNESETENEDETETENEDETEDEDSNSSSSDDSSSKKVSAKISTSEAYAIAAKLTSSPIKKIEFEAEDDKATYKVEYVDGSKAEINAVTGNVIKSDIKDSSDEDDS